MNNSLAVDDDMLGLIDRPAPCMFGHIVWSQSFSIVVIVIVEVSGHCL